MSIVDAVRAGDRRLALEGVALELALAIQSVSEDVRLEALSRELRLVLKELAELPPAGGGSLDDALAARRKAKQAANG